MQQQQLLGLSDQKKVEEPITTSQTSTVSTTSEAPLLQSSNDLCSSQHDLASPLAPPILPCENEVPQALHENDVVQSAPQELPQEVAVREVPQDVCPGGGLPVSAAKRRRITGPVGLPPFLLKHPGSGGSVPGLGGGFLDNCRICGVQIIRKGQSRPRICLSCEKKKATPIKDVCKDCRDPIVRSNVRKARICHKCKKTRERAKAEGILGAGVDMCGSAAAAAAAVGLGGSVLTGFPPTFSMFRRIYSVKSRLQFISQYQLSEAAAAAMGMPTNQEGYLSSDEDDVVQDSKHGIIPTRRKLPNSVAPPYSGLKKIDTDALHSPEDIVEFLVQRITARPSRRLKEEVNQDFEEQQTEQQQTVQPRQESSSSGEVKSKSRESILVPFVNPFEACAALAAAEKGKSVTVNPPYLKTIKEELAMPTECRQSFNLNNTSSPLPSLVRF